MEAKGAGHRQEETGEAKRKQVEGEGGRVKITLLTFILRKGDYIEKFTFGKLLYNSGLLLTEEEIQLIMDKIGGEGTTQITYEQFFRWWREDERVVKIVRMDTYGVPETLDTFKKYSKYVFFCFEGGRDLQTETRESEGRERRRGRKEERRAKKEIRKSEETGRIEGGKSDF
jgi:hypothetical protein